MTHREQYNLSPADAAQFCQLWSGHVDALERHLSARTWALWGVSAVVIAYPIARTLVLAALHSIVNVVPEVVRTVLHLI